MIQNWLLLAGSIAELAENIKKEDAVDARRMKKRHGAECGLAAKKEELIIVQNVQNI